MSEDNSMKTKASLIKYHLKKIRRGENMTRAARIYIAKNYGNQRIYRSKRGHRKLTEIS
jgi:hypothetical protein